MPQRNTHEAEIEAGAGRHSGGEAEQATQRHCRSAVAAGGDAVKEQDDLGALAQHRQRNGGGERP